MKDLLQTLEAKQPVVYRRNMYYRSAQPLRYTRSKIDPRIMPFRTNLCKVAVQAVAERIRLTDVKATIRGRDASQRARQLIQDCDLPMLLQSIVTDALAVGSAYLLVWVDGYGRPCITGESAEQMAVLRDPITREVTEAVKRWYVQDANGVIRDEYVVRYTPTKILRFKRDTFNGRLAFQESIDNPLGVVPVVPLINVERLGDDTGTSVVDDLAPLIDALNKVFIDMLTTSESVARPKRWATGVDLEERDEFGVDEGWTAANATAVDQKRPTPDAGEVRAPFTDADDMWVSEAPESKFGQLAGADLGGYKTAVDLIVQQIMAVSALPAHLVGITSANPATAEALRASEVSLASNAQSRINVFNRPIEWAVRLLVAIDAGADPADVEVDLTWADPSTRSVAQAADAAGKLHQEQIITTDEARELVGAGSEI